MNDNILAAGVATAPEAVSARRGPGKALRIAAACAPDTWRGKALVVFRQELDKAAPDRFDVHIHFGGTPVAQGAEIDAMLRGDIEGALTLPQDIANRIPEYSIFDTAYVMHDPAHLDAVFDGDIGREYRRRVSDEIGVQIVRSQFYEYSHMILREPREVRSPDDLAGVRLRMPTPEVWVFLGAALGADATPLPFKEVFEAMRTGAVDGLEYPLADAIACGFHTVSRQVVLSAHIVSNVFFTLSNSFWYGLSAEERVLIADSAARAKVFNDGNAVTAEAESIAFLRKHGLIVATPDIPRFRDRVQRAFLGSPFGAKWPKGLLDRINAAGA